jgi:hypothetical protein
MCHSFPVFLRAHFNPRHYKMRFKDATKPAASQTLACTHSCINTLLSLTLTDQFSFSPVVWGTVKISNRDHDAHQPPEIKTSNVQLALQIPHADCVASFWQHSHPCCHPVMRNSYESVNSLYLSHHNRYLIQLCVWDSTSHSIKQSVTISFLMQKKMISSSCYHIFNSLYTTHFITFTEIISHE